MWGRVLNAGIDTQYWYRYGCIPNIFPNRTDIWVGEYHRYKCSCIYNHQHRSNHPLFYWQIQIYANSKHFSNTTHRCASNFLPPQRLSVLPWYFWPVKRRHIRKRVTFRNPSRLMNHFPHCLPSLLEIYTIITTAIISFSALHLPGTRQWHVSGSCALIWSGCFDWLTFGVTALRESIEAICLAEGLLLIKRSGRDSQAVCILSVNMGKSGTSWHQ